jgi:hypothetical protein
MRCPASLRLSIASSRTLSSSTMTEVYEQASSDHSIVSPLTQAHRLGALEEEEPDEGDLSYNNHENPFMFRDAMLKLLLAETLPYKKLIAE